MSSRTPINRAEEKASTDSRIKAVDAAYQIIQDTLSNPDSGLSVLEHDIYAQYSEEMKQASDSLKGNFDSSKGSAFRARYKGNDVEIANTVLEKAEAQARALANRAWNVAQNADEIADQIREIAGSRLGDGKLREQITTAAAQVDLDSQQLGSAHDLTKADCESLIQKYSDDAKDVAKSIVDPIKAARAEEKREAAALAKAEEAALRSEQGLKELADDTGIENLEDLQTYLDIADEIEAEIAASASPEASDTESSNSSDEPESHQESRAQTWTSTRAPSAAATEAKKQQDEKMADRMVKPLQDLVKALENTKFSALKKDVKAIETDCRVLKRPPSAEKMADIESRMKHVPKAESAFKAVKAAMKGETPKAGLFDKIKSAVAPSKSASQNNEARKAFQSNYTAADQAKASATPSAAAPPPTKKGPDIVMGGRRT